MEHAESLACAETFQISRLSSAFTNTVEIGYMKRKWDRLSEEEKQKAIKELIDFYEVERDEKIGVIAADEILNHFLHLLEPSCTTKALRMPERHFERV